MPKMASTADEFLESFSDSSEAKIMILINGTKSFAFEFFSGFSFSFLRIVLLISEKDKLSHEFSLLLKVYF
jgi:hypothetical protein